MTTETLHQKTGPAISPKQHSSSLPSPEEYLRSNPIPGGMLYYPGSFVDAEPMKLFHGHGGIRRFIHVDYRPGISEEYYKKTTESIFNGSMTTRSIGPEKFKARRWKDLWHPQVGERWGEATERSFGFHQEFRLEAPQKHVDFMFMSIDAVGAWRFLIQAGYLPNVVVLCADGLNWAPGGFGGEGVFYEEVKKAGHWPEYLFVGCATPWPGYRQVSRTVKKYDVPARAIYRRDGLEKSSYCRTMKSRLKWNGKSVQPMRSTPANCNNVSDGLVVTATRMNQDGDALKHMNQHQADTDPESQLEAILAAEGENCDQTACGQGGFGSFTNPVPVAGLDGMMEYLRSLRGSAGQELSMMIKDVRISDLLDHPVETYEVWTKDESQKALISFSRFHPRNSTLAPEGFHLVGGKQ